MKGLTPVPPSPVPLEHHPLSSVDGFIVVAGDSTHGAIAKDWAGTLQLYEPDRAVHLVYTGNDEGLDFPDLEERNRHRLAVALEAGGLANKMVIVGGGDGSIHYAVRALLHDDMPQSATSAILTSWALGNANDFYFGTQDGHMAGYCLGTLEHPAGRAVDIYPMEITDEDGNLLDYATMYWTGGATADAAAIFGSKQHRERKKRLPDSLSKLADAIGGAPALWLPERFEISINGGEPTSMTEIQVINGDRMAIEARYPSRLSHREVFLSTVQSNSPLALGAAALRMKLGRPKGELRTEPVKITVTGKKPVPIQSDGEPGFLQPGSTTIVKSSNRGVRAWSTKKNV